MIAIISLLITLSLSMLVTRIAAVALTLTGLSPEVAMFQARSAFTGVGFTTGEAEKVINHPVRRRIIMMLMLVGNIGIAAVIATTIISLLSAQADKANWTFYVTMLAGGIIFLWVFFSSKLITRYISKIIEWALRHWTRLDVSDYVALLHLSKGYVVVEISVNPDDWVSDKTLAELALSREGVLVLGIHRENGHYVGSPNGSIKVLPGDQLSLYGPIERLEEINLRTKGTRGDVAHEQAIHEQDEKLVSEVSEQERHDEEEKVKGPSDKFKDLME